ncbi:MAG TPA: hypothetical protein VL240_00880 [Candidatus Binatia bacterium]|nr:hypothetical protein [Candidatus Binatia bacterium]
MRYTTRTFFRLGIAGVLAAVLLGCGVSGAAQVRSQTPLPGDRQQQPNADDSWEAQQRREMQKKYNLQRQQEISKDAEKLLELATELKQSVDRSSENTLSLDVIRKAEQIEKLAKTVKDKMKGP